MYNMDELQKLELIQEKIDLINEIVSDFGNISTALKDKKVGRPSILMHLISMAEQFNKLKENSAFEILAKFDKDDLKGSYDIRSFIAHDHEGVNLAIIESVIRTKLPKIQTVVKTILETTIE